MSYQCKTAYCDNDVDDFNMYCNDCKETPKTFSEQMQEASQSIEARMASLEAEVRQLKKWAGLK